MNVLVISGRLTADAEVRTIDSGKSLLSFSLADNEIYYDTEGKKVDTVEFHNCFKWSKTIPKVADFLIKGRSISVKGRLVTNRWKDKEGNDRSRKALRISELNL
ncbi:single-stranded DNA-binding protein [Reichenbachiella agariperforans]|uniref:single-stranded DNA-binding protein n=1 Tax=Reichenbachiella agariperforans TaxID=156994 RepID=UPI001C08C0D3|nr:single-stranded DNA-binding protein [Reichenbachiella agariperforans]MBU2915955.1 single-stranded DNA-binding protein [Reichenbachiella agariperforans]